MIRPDQNKSKNRFHFPSRISISEALFSPNQVSIQSLPFFFGFVPVPSHESITFSVNRDGIRKCTCYTFGYWVRNSSATLFALVGNVKHMRVFTSHPKTPTNDTMRRFTCPIHFCSSLSLFFPHLFARWACKAVPTYFFRPYVDRECSSIVGHSLLPLFIVFVL